MCTARADSDKPAPGVSERKVQKCQEIHENQFPNAFVVLNVFEDQLNVGYIFHCLGTAGLAYDDT